MTPPLFKHQIEAIEKAYNQRCFALFLECGLGKTRCVIELVKRYSRQTLVVAPNTILENWRDEVEKFSDLKCVVLQGTKAKRCKLLKEPADIFVINYEALRTIIDELIKMNFFLMVCDESTKIKGYKTLQGKAACKLGQTVPYRLILTGTPITNSPLDMFGQYKFLNPHIFGFSFYKFKTRYALWGGYGSYTVKEYINLDELQRKVYQCAIRMRKRDCLDLPDKLYQRHLVDLTKQQRYLYDLLKRDFIAEIEGKQVTAPYVLTRLIRFSQITAGFIKDAEGTEIDFEGNPKLEWLREFIEGLPHDEKVVIFCKFIKEIENLQRLLKSMDIEHISVYGATPQALRQGFINTFNKSLICRVFIGQVETSGIGINLQSARYCVFLSNSYSHGSRLQCEERLHRIGQARNVTYIDVLARQTIDETVLECLKSKGELAYRVIEEMRR